MAGLVAFEAGLCECGWHKTMASDESNDFTFEDVVCPVCAGAQQWGRVLHKKEEDLVKQWGDDPSPRRPRPSDGRRTFPRLMTPAEILERAVKNAPKPHTREGGD